MRVAMTDLGLVHLWIVYPRTETYEFDEGLTPLPPGNLQDVAPPRCRRVRCALQGANTLDATIETESSELVLMRRQSPSTCR